MFGDDKKLYGSEWGNIYGIIDDLKISFPHSSSKQTAYDEWNRRKQRFNYNNIYVLTYAESESELKRFCNIKYDGVCITNLETNISNVYKPIDLSSAQYANIPFSMLNRSATGALKGLDWISCILEKRIVKDSFIIYR